MKKNESKMKANEGLPSLCNYLPKALSAKSEAVKVKMGKRVLRG